jgi:glycerophosphoryl diester phosphodiesterase
LRLGTFVGPGHGKIGVSRAFDTDFFAPPRPRIFGHRGAAGEFPENTMFSFERAVRAGAIYLELDVHMSRDGEIVVSHDEGLTRTCGRDALIRETNWAEIQDADAGYMLTLDGGATFPFRGRSVKVPRLSAVLGAFVGVNYLIEIKQTEPSLVSELLETVDASGLRRRVLIASEFDEPIHVVRRLAPQIPTNFPYGEVAEFLQAMAGNRPGYEPRGAALQIPPEYQGWQLVTSESVEFAHRSGVELHVWTVNEESEMNRLLECGVDGLISGVVERYQ